MFDPLAGFMVLALWAIPMTTGKGPPFLMTAVCALDEKLSATSAAATPHGMKGFHLSGQYGISALSHKCVVVFINDGRHFHGDTPLKFLRKVSVSLFIARRLSCSVTWVR
jgi:hypothetical protein